LQQAEEDRRRAQAGEARGVTWLANPGYMTAPIITPPTPEPEEMGSTTAYP
jgi:hypothetical protein